MQEKEKHRKKWEVSILELEEYREKRFKVIKKIPAELMFESKTFETREEARKQFEDWIKIISYCI